MRDSRIGLRTFWDDDAGAMEKIGAAQWFIVAWLGAGLLLFFVVTSSGSQQALGRRLAGSQDTMNKHQRLSGTVFTVAKWVSRGLDEPFGQV